MEPHELAAQLRKPDGEIGIEVGKRMNEGNALMHALVMELLDVRDNHSVFEIGFGNGKFIPEILGKAKDLSYSGVDISSTMLEEAQGVIRAAGISGQANVQLGNVSALPFPDGQFDRAFTINTIYFWEDPANDIKEIYRVLKPGGMFLLSFRPKKQAQHLPFTKFGFTLYDIEDALELLHEGGFANPEITYRDEPSFEINGQQVTMGSYCVKAGK